MFQKNWQELIKPQKLKVDGSHDAGRAATLVAEPLERGFGLTLGNALRRVLLSSLQGAAVTSIHIEGVLHEFSSIPGVREDVTDIVLNVKQIAMRMHAEGPKRLTLRATGPGEITAGQITPVADIEILNPGLVLCTLDEKVEFRMELTVATGKGYVPADRNVLLFLLARAERRLCHRAGSYFVTFFLPAIALAGPLRVRALVCVRCPRTGRPLRCLRPR